VFVARAHLATRDFIFANELGPAGELTTGLSKFAPGSKLVVREADGRLRVLLDTSLPPGDPLNPLGLRDVQSPDVSFDAARIVFAGTTGPRMFKDRSYARPRYSWRIYEIRVDGTALRQLTYDDREITIPGADAADTLGNAATYSFYDDLFPAYLADGRVVLSSSRYPSRSYYDGRPTFNLYVMNSDGAGLHRITTERGSALHPTPLPDGRILWSRWWVNFNQPSETGIYSRIDNGPGTEIARDQNSRPVLIERRVRVQPTVAPPVQPTATVAPTASPSARRPTPTIAGVARPTATPPVPHPTATPPVPPPPQTVVVSLPITGYRLPDNTLVYSNTTTTFNPARARLPNGTLVRDAPNTWHLMTVNSDGTDMRRFAWTPRYAYHLTTDGGQDTYNAAQPAPVISNGELLVAYTSQRDGTMAHSTLNTGIRVARPGVAQIARNTTESIAGYRWNNPTIASFALHPAGLPDGRILFSQTVTDMTLPSSGGYRFAQNGKLFTLPLQGSQLRYELRTIRPDGAEPATVLLDSELGSADALDAKPIVVRPVGEGPGQWRAQVDRFDAPISDDPLLGNIPRGLFDTYGQPAYTWSARTIEQVALAILHNPNVYANPPLSLPFVNNSPPLGSVAFADIYIDANQFTGAGYNAAAPDDQVRAVKWTTVPVDPQGAFTVAVPADTPVFIVLRDKDHRIVRGGNRGALAIAQGNAPARPGQTVTCVGCHMGHASGSLDGQPLAALGWTNVAPAAAVTATSEWANGDDPYYNGKAAHLIDRRNYLPADAQTGGYQDRTLPWIAAGSRSVGQSVQLSWSLPIAALDVRLVGAEPGQAGFSDDYAVSGELRFFLGGEEIAGARQTVAAAAPLRQAGTMVSLPKPLAIDRMVFTITGVTGKRYGGAPPAALSEIEVIGRGATPDALAGRPTVMNLPLVGR
jgi:hypothetical protein